MSARRFEVEIGTLVVDDPRLARGDLASALGAELERLLGGAETHLPAGDRQIATVRTQLASGGDLDGGGVGRAVAAAAFEVLGR